jgi:hypothetical protein
MTTVDHETLAAWLSTWKRHLKEPKELLLGRIFANIAAAAREELAERYLHLTSKRIERSKPGWERRFLGLLESVFKHTPHRVDLYRLQYGW